MKSYVSYNSKNMTFWKRQNYYGSKNANGFHSLGEKKDE
jgi:hypothetical protein